MENFKLVKNEEGFVRNHSDIYSIKNYLTKDFSENFSLAVSTLLDGEHELTRSVSSDRLYYFIEADAIFNVDRNDLKISNEDVLFIEKGTWYSFSGHFKAVLINMPAFGVEKNNDKNK